MLKKRIISAFAIMPVILASVWAGGWPFFALVALFSHLALREFYNLSRNSDKAVQWLGYSGNIILLFVMALKGIELYFIALVIYLLVISSIWVFLYPRDFMLFASLLWGKLYITTLIGFFILLREQSGGLLHVLAVLAVIWSNDSGAYLVGSNIGRHHIFPQVSPKKTLEGAIAGIVVAILVIFLLSPLFDLNRGFALLFAFTLALSGQFGDFTESALKRWSDTKDSGDFLPGHGGVLDRIDSLLFAAPIAYILIRFLR